MISDSFDDDSMLEKAVLRCGALLRRRNAVRRSLALFGGTIVLYLVWCLLFGVIGGISHESERHSLAYGLEETQVDAYVWLGGVADQRLSRTLLDARQRAPHWRSQRRSLVVVGNGTATGDGVISNSTKCANFYYSHHRRAEWLMHTATEALLAGAGAAKCICSAQFGSTDERYMALYVAETAPSPPSVTSGISPHTTEFRVAEPRAEVAELLAEQRRDLAGDHHHHHSSRVLHAIEVVDTDEEAYDRLDVAAFDEQGVQLAIVYENQDYRFNHPRGTFAVLRRATLQLSYRDTHCHIVTLRLAGEAAFCAQQCLDLMNGIDVRERARRQWQNSGVQLNASHFESVYGTTKTKAISAHTEL
jgi:hypothetical protein